MEIDEQESMKSSIQLYPLYDLKVLLINHLNKTHQLISNEKLIHLLRKHSELEKKEIDIGFNIFLLVSDTYYRENFHSDILQAILDPYGKHNEGARFLHSFISFLNEHSKKGWINKSEYQNTVVEREAGKIDISIKDIKSKKAIIIENKINNAIDMGRQIPRYVKHLENEGYEIDSVVYLLLNTYKTPPTFDWTDKEKDEIFFKLQPVVAYDETPGDLFSGWLTKCERQVQNIDTLFLLRQYKNLIAYLGGKNMNKPLMEEFLQSMLKDNNYNTAVALNSMLQDLLYYRRDKIIDTFKFDNTPFKQVFYWKNCAVLDNFFINEDHFAIDVIVEPDRYRCQFFVRGFDSKNILINPATTVLQEIKLIDSFFEVGDRWEKQFLFPLQEDELYQFITDIKTAFKKYTSITQINEQQ